MPALLADAFPGVRDFLDASSFLFTGGGFVMIRAYRTVAQRHGPFCQRHFHSFVEKLDHVFEWPPAQHTCHPLHTCCRL